MGMYFLEIAPVQTLDSTFSYGISVMASSDGSITSNEVFQFTLNDIFTNVALDAPEKTKANYENNIVTWEVGTLDALSKDTPLVLNVNVEHPTELQEGTLIASAITNTFLNEQGEEMIENYDDFNFDPQPSTPEFRLDITLKDKADCVYTLEFKATNLSNQKNLSNVSYSYTLDPDFQWQSPLNDSNFTPTTWIVGNLSKDGPPVTKTAIIKYTGAVSVNNKTVFLPVSGTAKYDTNRSATYKGVFDYKQKVDPCPPPPTDCCEPCPPKVPVDFGKCEQSKHVTVTADIDSDGREIKVKIHLNNVCKNKKVVVGLELFAGMPTDSNPVRKALKVIQLTRETAPDGCAPLECDCATFFIPSPICPEQHFFIKAQAHYFDDTPSTCNCTCSTTNGILE